MSVFPGLREPDESWRARREPPRGRPFWVERRGLEVVSSVVGEKHMRYQVSSDVSGARATFANATEDYEGVAAPRPGDTLVLRVDGEIYFVTAETVTREGKLFRVVDTLGVSRDLIPGRQCEISRRPEGSRP